MRTSSQARAAAATGLDFAALVVAATVVARVKHLHLPGDVALHASDVVFGTVALLYGVAAVVLFVFVATFAARLRRLEGGSGRLAACVNASGSFVAGIVALSVGIMWAARQASSTELAALTNSVVYGPTLFFPIAALVGAGGLVGVRARGLPAYSRVSARLSIPLALAYVAGAGLLLFKDYAWINDTGYVAFTAWVAWLGVIGILRWGDMDEPTAAAQLARPEAAEAHPPAAEEVPAVDAGTEEVTLAVPLRRPVRRPAKAAGRKPARKRPAPQRGRRRGETP